MIIGKSMDKLIDNIYVVLAKYTPDRNIMNKVNQELSDRNIRNSRQLLGKMIPLETQKAEVIFILANALYNATDESDINPNEFFTEVEIADMKDYMGEEREVIQFPLILENVMELGDNQWSTVVSIQELTSWYNSNLVNYNFETQRDPKYIERRDGSLIKKPNVNWDSVEDIYEKLIANLFHSNYITLNVLVNGEDDIAYDPDKKALIIRSGQIDVLDGFHRSLAMLKAIATNKNLNYKTGLMITNFNVQIANDFIRQEDKRNKIDERHIKSKNDENLMNGIVTMLNTNPKSDMRGKIATDMILIQKNIAYTLNDIISDTMEIVFKNDVKTRRDVNKVGEYLIKFFNEIYGIKYDDFENLKKSRESSMVANENIFMLYVVLAKFLHEKEDWRDKLESIMNSIDFSKDNPIWSKLKLKTQRLTIDSRNINRINKYIESI